jgi:electron transport complex protein RnfC
VTIQNIAAQVPFGMSPAKLLSLANLTPMEGDSIVLGGLMRGIATLRPDRGLPPWVEGIFLLRKGKNRPRPMGVCRKCGRCESVCPLKLPVGVLGANPPFEWKNILKISPDLLKCPACGLCALNCPENIPLNLFRENGDRVPS